MIADYDLPPKGSFAIIIDDNAGYSRSKTDSNDLMKHIRIVLSHYGYDISSWGNVSSVKKFLEKYEEEELH